MDKEKDGVEVFTFRREWIDSYIDLFDDEQLNEYIGALVRYGIYGDIIECKDKWVQKMAEEHYNQIDRIEDFKERMKNAAKENKTTQQQKVEADYDIIMERLKKGDTLQKLANDYGYKSKSSVYNWRAYKDFKVWRDEQNKSSKVVQNEQKNEQRSKMGPFNF